MSRTPNEDEPRFGEKKIQTKMRKENVDICIYADALPSIQLKSLEISNIVQVVSPNLATPC